MITKYTILNIECNKINLLLLNIVQHEFKIKII